MENIFSKTIIGQSNPIQIFFPQIVENINITLFLVLDEKNEIIYDDNLYFIRSQYSIPNDNNFDFKLESNQNLGCVFGIYADGMASEEHTFFLMKKIVLRSNTFNVEIVDEKGILINFKEKQFKYMFSYEY